ncbi:TfoX/Sxy family protein [Kitasatospora sp. NBC_00315]|uniref:TfoX/Sxy family protein n=1 Tax=Kitasatospora sp. NBC_00315 TaxID=2975963 RepID=UPI0032438C76
MSGSRSLAEHPAAQPAPLGEVTAHRCSGSRAVRSHGSRFATVMDTLHLRVDGVTRSSYEEAGSTPFTYRAGGREVVVHAYYGAEAEVIDDRAELCALARPAVA